MVAQTALIVAVIAKTVKPVKAFCSRKYLPARPCVLVVQSHVMRVWKYLIT